jgi:hypothetical protein
MIYLFRKNRVLGSRTLDCLVVFRNQIGQHVELLSYPHVLSAVTKATLL